MTWEMAGQIGTLLIAAAVAWWGHQRGKRSDAVSAQSGVAAETRLGTQQIIDGLNMFVDQLQERGTVYRDSIAVLEARLAACSAELDLAKKENARMHRKYGENGATT